jgi:hypothetical protein
MITDVDKVFRSTEGGRWLESFEASLLEWIGSNGFIELPVVIVGTVDWFKWNQLGWERCKVRSELFFPVVMVSGSA